MSIQVGDFVERERNINMQVAGYSMPNLDPMHVAGSWIFEGNYNNKEHIEARPETAELDRSTARNQYKL